MTLEQLDARDDRLVRLALDGQGPLTVGTDAQCNSLNSTLTEQAEARVPEILARLGEDHPAG